MIWKVQGWTLRLLSGGGVVPLLFLCPGQVATREQGCYDLGVTRKGDQVYRGFDGAPEGGLFESPLLSHRVVQGFSFGPWKDR